MWATNKKDLQKIKSDPCGYEDLIIKPDGEIICANFGHVNALEKIMNIPSDILYQMIAIWDNPQFWLIENTGCMAVSYKASFGMNTTTKQKEAYSILVKNKIVSNNFFDIKEYRKAARKRYSKF